MIVLVEALRYRSLCDVRQALGPLQVLVGPNASGKSTFLDVPQFLGDLLQHGLVEAVRRRSPDLQDLVWMGERSPLELAVELRIPDERRLRLPNGYGVARYEVAIGHGTDGALTLAGETLWLKPPEQHVFSQRSLFPDPKRPRSSLFRQGRPRLPEGWRKVVEKKVESGNDYFLAETTNWRSPFRLGAQRPALANLPEDDERFPVAVWVKRTLIDNLQTVTLDSRKLRLAAPPGSQTRYQPDGANLPWVIEHLRQHWPQRFEEWVAHVRTALRDLRSVETVVRDDDRHRYLRLNYGSGLTASSWNLSDGTLRLLALTLIGYLDAPRGTVYMIEEPENGIHPQAVECVYQAFAAAPDVQVLCASHSPVVLSLAAPETLLCFARAKDGQTDVVNGSEHPRLAEWRQETDLGTLFAAGVLG